jgi:quinohemoprotein amine dehydrogenase
LDGVWVPVPAIKAQAVTQNTQLGARSILTVETSSHLARPSLYASLMEKSHTPNHDGLRNPRNSFVMSTAFKTPNHFGFRFVPRYTLIDRPCSSHPSVVRVSADDTGENMPPTFRVGLGPAVYLLVTLVLGKPALAQNSAEGQEGIPVTDPLVIAKCGGCHARDEHGTMQRLSWERTTPEGWQDALKDMILREGLSVTPVEARSIVKYLSSSHGLAAAEAEPVRYDPERRIHDETAMVSETLHETCGKCHSLARALSWRRSVQDWKQFADSHATRYHIPSTTEAVEYLSKTAPLHSLAWDARTGAQNLSGRWLLTASMPGHGTYYGEMQIDRDGHDEYNTRATLTSIRDGSRVLRTGRTVAFGESAWRGRSKGNGPTTAPDDPSAEAREVLLIAADQSTAEGRWFWGQYQEFGFEVKLRRASSAPTLLAVDRLSLKTGSRLSRIRLIGDHFPAQIAAADLNFGPGVTVRDIASNSQGEIVALLDVSSDAPLGKHDVAFRGSSLPEALAIYDRIDYLKVTPDSIVGAFGDRTHPKGYQQFEAIGYQRGPDDRAHTADDVALGPVDAAWAVQVFHAAEGNSDSVGAMNSQGLFTPADKNPNLNFDCWVIATARDEKDRSGAPLVGKSYMVVTVPTYTFNGRRYVRDLDRWVDDGPDR